MKNVTKDPKEKAIELVKNFGSIENAVKCVDEILSLNKNEHLYGAMFPSVKEDLEWWKQVKNELKRWNI